MMSGVPQPAQGSMMIPPRRGSAGMAPGPPQGPLHPISMQHHPPRSPPLTRSASMAQPAGKNQLLLDASKRRLSLPIKPAPPSGPPPIQFVDGPFARGPVSHAVGKQPPPPSVPPPSTTFSESIQRRGSGLQVPRPAPPAGPPPSLSTAPVQDQRGGVARTSSGGTPTELGPIQSRRPSELGGPKPFSSPKRASFSGIPPGTAPGASGAPPVVGIEQTNAQQNGRRPSAIGTIPQGLENNGRPSPMELRRYSIGGEEPVLGGGAGFGRRLSSVSDGAGTPSGSGIPPPPLATLANTGQQPESDIAALSGASHLFNQGVTFQKGGDFVAAANMYRKASHLGHAKAQHNLGAMHEKGGGGVPRDDAEAVRLFTLAADSGLAESCYSLAMHYKFGLGLEQDDRKCIYYLEKASTSGLAKAMFNLGLMYEKQRGVDPNIPLSELLEAARDCYQAAAMAGITKSAVNLGVLYLTGKLQDPDGDSAVHWFRLAADRGDASGKWNLALCYERGVGVPRDPAAARALRDEVKASEVASDQNHNHTNPGVNNAIRRGSVQPSPPPFPPPATAIIGGGIAASTGMNRNGKTLNFSNSSQSKSDALQDTAQGYAPTSTTGQMQHSPDGSTGTGNASHESIVNSNTRQQRGSVSFIAPSPPSGPPPARQQRNSSTDGVPPQSGERAIMAPTPEAIARVKAAVEARRRKSLLLKAHGGAGADDASS